MSSTPTDPDRVPSDGGHGYPLTFTVDYPERALNRLSTAFRIVAIIPIAILAGTVEGGSFGGSAGGHGAAYVGGGIGVLFIPVLLMLLFRRKYPRWWYDWNLQLTRFSNRIAVYLALMDDRYPSTDEEQSVHLDFPYPDAAGDLNRGLPLVKWLLAIPHYIALFFLTIAAILAVIAAWFAILASGRYPRALFGFVEGVLRWHNRVGAYAFLLITDRYPPFSLRP
jgi:predicted small integral membrane protein